MFWNRFIGPFFLNLLLPFCRNHWDYSPFWMKSLLSLMARIWPLPISLSSISIQILVSEESERKHLLSLITQGRYWPCDNNFTVLFSFIICLWYYGIWILDSEILQDLTNLNYFWVFPGHVVLFFGTVTWATIMKRERSDRLNWFALFFFVNGYLL